MVSQLPQIGNTARATTKIEAKCRSLSSNLKSNRAASESANPIRRAIEKTGLEMPDVRRAPVRPKDIHTYVN
jgi:hypothetical protein